MELVFYPLVSNARFDCCIVSISLLDLLIQLVSTITGGGSSLGPVPQLIRIMRVLRITRILKLVKNLQSLQRLVATINFSVPAIVNVSSLLFLVYFIFAVLGCFLFKDITFLNSAGYH